MILKVLQNLLLPFRMERQLEGTANSETKENVVHDAYMIINYFYFLHFKLQIEWNQIVSLE